MPQAYHDIYKIRTSDVWEYESECFLKGNRSRAEMQELYTLMHSFYQGEENKPFIKERDDSDYASQHRKYYRDHIDGDEILTYFIRTNAAYDLNTPCDVTLDPANPLPFQKMFVLKLRQYQDGLLYLADFLAYHLHNSFENDLLSFRRFFIVSLQQYPETVDKRIEALAYEWFKEDSLFPKEDKTIVEEQLLQVVAFPPVDNGEGKIKNDHEVEDAEWEGTVEEETEDPVDKPSGQIVIPQKTGSGDKAIIEQPLPTPTAVKVTGKLTDDEVRQFFSFLYKEKNKEGVSFLTEEEVAEIFADAITIPLTVTRKYKLAQSPGLTKKTIEYCIYKFFTIHAKNGKKEDILRFFGSYIIDFEVHVANGKTLRAWSNNVRGEKPKSMWFGLKPYLPERLHWRA